MGVHFRAFYDRDILPPGAKTAHANVTAKEARKAFAKGATLCVNAISEVDPVLGDFVRAVKAQLHYPGPMRFNAYYSPPGRGLPFHFDARVTCSLQISGAKTWTFSPEAAVPWPRGNADLRQDGTPEYFDGVSGTEDWERGTPWSRDQFEEVTLETGDVLFLPAGAWHTARGVGESLALNLAIEPSSPLDMLTEVLRLELRKDPRWRAIPPTVRGRNGRLPTETVRFLKERIAELGRALEALDLDGPEVSGVWAGRISGRK